MNIIILLVVGLLIFYSYTLQKEPFNANIDSNNDYTKEFGYELKPLEHEEKIDDKNYYHTNMKPFFKKSMPNRMDNFDGYLDRYGSNHPINKNHKKDVKNLWKPYETIDDNPDYGNDTKGLYTDDTIDRYHTNTSNYAQYHYSIDGVTVAKGMTNDYTSTGQGGYQPYYRPNELSYEEITGQTKPVYDIQDRIIEGSGLNGKVYTDIGENTRTKPETSFNITDITLGNKSNVQGHLIKPFLMASNTNKFKGSSYTGTGMKESSDKLNTVQRDPLKQFNSMNNELNKYNYVKMPNQSTNEINSKILINDNIQNKRDSQINIKRNNIDLTNTGVINKVEPKIVINDNIQHKRELQMNNKWNNINLTNKGVLNKFEPKILMNNSLLDKRQMYLRSNIDGLKNKHLSNPTSNNMLNKTPIKYDNIKNNRINAPDNIEGKQLLAGDIITNTNKETFNQISGANYNKNTHIDLTHIGKNNVNNKYIDIDYKTLSGIQKDGYNLVNEQSKGDRLFNSNVVSNGLMSKTNLRTEQYEQYENKDNIIKDIGNRNPNTGNRDCSLYQSNDIDIRTLRGTNEYNNQFNKYKNKQKNRNCDLSNIIGENTLNKNNTIYTRDDFDLGFKSKL
jgi:hypothetical protein